MARKKLGRDANEEMVYEGDYVSGEYPEEDGELVVFYGKVFYTEIQHVPGVRYVAVERSDHVVGGAEGNRWLVPVENIKKIATGAENEVAEWDSESVDHYHEMMEQIMDSGIAHFKKDHNVELTVEQREQMLEVLKRIVPFMAPAQTAIIAGVLIGTVQHHMFQSLMQRAGIEDPSAVDNLAEHLLAAGLIEKVIPDADNKEQVKDRVVQAMDATTIEGDDPASEILRRAGGSLN